MGHSFDIQQDGVHYSTLCLQMRLTAGVVEEVNTSRLFRVKKHGLEN